MIGNDIIDIDLALEQSNWKRPRYLDKIFTLKEQDLVLSSKEQDLTVWQLWSMKEAAYKLYTQLNPSRFYNPRAFECIIKNSGAVRYKTFECHVKTKTTSKYVLSEAYLNKNQIYSKVLALNKISYLAQSEMLQEELVTHMAQYLRCDKKQLKFVKHQYGIPTVEYKTSTFNISLSHHGRFGTIAFAN